MFEQQLKREVSTDRARRKLNVRYCAAPRPRVRHSLIGNVDTSLRASRWVLTS
jgi:hypothetical protein